MNNGEKTGLMFYYREFHVKQANTYKIRSKRPKLINLRISCMRLLSAANERAQGIMKEKVSLPVSSFNCHPLLDGHSLPHEGSRGDV